MSKIILIETSTALCSTALAVDGRIAEYRESTQPRAHAAMTAVFVKEMLDAQGLRAADCDAVCVSAGPGSYTGLRVGSSTAKGLCFATGIPLLAAGTLEVLAWQAVQDGLVPEGCRYIIPMIDARRMEVYTAVFSRTPETHADRTHGGRRRQFRRPALGRTGAVHRRRRRKMLRVIGSGNAHFVQTCPRASSMLGPAERELAARNFRDTAYFEPFYLKQFIATVSRKKII